MKLLELIGWVSFAVGIVAFPFTIVMIRGRPVLSILIFVVPLFIAFLVDQTSRDMVQVKVLEQLDSLDKNHEIRIDSVPVSTRSDVLEALRKLHRVVPHHSHPTKRINVEIVDSSKDIVLTLARDSSNSEEYWVFYPRYYLNSYHDIGHIVTPVFDAY